MSAVAEVIDEFYARLEASIAAGQPLEQWTVERQPVEVMQGRADKPGLIVLMPTISEDDAGSGMAKPAVTARMTVASNKVVTRDGAEAVESGLSAHADAVESAKNAFELSTASPRAADLLMGQRLIEPMRWDASQAFVFNETLQTNLTLTMRLRAIQRGAR